MGASPNPTSPRKRKKTSKKYAPFLLDCGGFLALPDLHWWKVSNAHAYIWPCWRGPSGAQGLVMFDSFSMRYIGMCEMAVKPESFCFFRGQNGRIGTPTVSYKKLWRQAYRCVAFLPYQLQAARTLCQWSRRAITLHSTPLLVCTLEQLGLSSQRFLFSHWADVLKSTGTVGIEQRGTRIPLHFLKNEEIDLTIGVQCGRGSYMELSCDDDHG